MLRPRWNSGNYLGEIFVFSEINVISLPSSQEWSILHPKFYADYEYIDHSKKIFTNSKYTLSLDKKMIYAADLAS